MNSSIHELSSARSQPNGPLESHGSLWRKKILRASHPAKAERLSEIAKDLSVSVEDCVSTQKSTIVVEKEIGIAIYAK